MRSGSRGSAASVSTPPGVNFHAVTDNDSPSALAAAAAEIALRDMLWRSSPCLAEGCEHEWRCLPVVEFRQTVICAHCGGLNAGLSRQLTERPDLFAVAEDGSVTWNVTRLRARLAEIETEFGARTRQFDQLCREHNTLVDQVIAGLATPEHEKIAVAGLPRCRCGYPLGGGRAPEEFITHALAVLARARDGETADADDAAPPGPDPGRAAILRAAGLPEEQIAKELGTS
jgi:hypothetical protein